jgi:guanine deaminase
MCLGALYWARPARIFFAATKDEAAAAGFDDSFIYREIQVPPTERSIPTIHATHENANRPFEEWVEKTDKTAY